MARIINMFDIRGKSGNEIHYYRNGKHCVRSVPARKSSKASLPQAKQRTKFAKASKFVYNLTPLLNKSIRNVIATLKGLNLDRIRKSI